MMGGGGGDNDPAINNAGEFLLQLLKNPPRSHSNSQTQQQHDPPPTTTTTTTHHHHHHNNTNNYFNHPPFGGGGGGFPQNPNPNPLPLNLHQPNNNNNNNLHYLSNLGLIHTNHLQNQHQQQQHRPRNNLVFGSLHSAPNLDYDLSTVENHLFNQTHFPNTSTSRLLNPPPPPPAAAAELTSLTFGNYVSTQSPSHQQQLTPMPPPPGFSGNTMKKMMMMMHSQHKHKHKHTMDNKTHLLPPTPTTTATDDEDASSRDLVDLEEHIDHLLLEDNDGTNNAPPKSRDKDYRSDKRGQWLLNQRMRNHRSHTQCRPDINTLNAPFLQIYDSLIPSQEELQKQKQLMALLNKHVTNQWPAARLFLYGSCANSFGFRKSDIDVCLAIGDADVDKAEILLKLADILKSDNLENVQALTRARVPIVKLMDPVTGISCDICVNNLLAVINTKLLRDYSKIDVRLRQLAFIVKHWAKSRGVNETYQGTLSSYAYVLMCIHFLQQRTPSILPCLQAMEITYKVNVDDVECSYFDQVDKLQGFGSRNGESIAQLVWAFFKYWAYCHDYANDVISIRMGCLISKREKDWTRRIGNDRHLICIEDPFEVSHDLGRVVDRRSIRVLREEFERAAEILQYDPNPCVKLFEPYVPS